MLITPQQKYRLKKRMSIILFSRPVHSGKTTELAQWIGQQKNIHGILMPDMNGSRKILDIRTKEIFDIECADPANTREELITVGKFHFYTAVFAKANLILINALAKQPGWLIIDEAGRLELDGKGFYDAIKKITGAYNNKEIKGNLLITVREELCKAVIDFFTLKDCRIIQRMEDTRE
jgi:nucleoside-triphosphatase THEP1